MKCAPTQSLLHQVGSSYRGGSLVAGGWTLKLGSVGFVVDQVDGRNYLPPLGDKMIIPPVIWFVVSGTR